MFDKFISFMYMVIIGITLLMYVTTVGYKTYQNSMINKDNIAIEAQRVMCDCAATQAYIEGKKGGI